jgi:hypothetical protein
MPPETEHRRWERRPADPRVVCDLLIGESVTCRTLAVANLSEGGARLLMSRPLAPGEPLWAFLHHEGRRFYCMRMAQVIYAHRFSGGAYILGVAFHRELSAAEVEGLRGRGVGDVVALPEPDPA